MEEEMFAPATPPPRARCVLRIRIPPAWTPEEDARLERLAKENVFRHWRRVARHMPGRSARFCRDRWRHHLARGVYHRPFTARDDDELIRLYQRLGGGRWKDIGRAVYGRTSRVMKRRWIELRRNAKNCPARKAYCPPELPSEDLETMESESKPSGVPASQHQEAYADVLASSFVSSCSLTCDAMDPRVGSLALGFASIAL